MKKLILVLAISLTVGSLALVACGGKDKLVEDSTESVSR
jgi:hypothetical protein